MAIELEDSPVIKTTAHGYTPFTPDAGIFCGGYQGPLYPNPTTFESSNENFDPRNFLNPVMDTYQMKSEPDFYEGLGSGNPGINYRNAGHILGLIDTFSRMSYGFRVIQAIREESQEFDFDPSVDISIPFLLNNRSIKNIGDTDLYPTLSEKPTDYLSDFVAGDGFLNLDPRVDEPFVFNEDIHSPSTNPISTEVLQGLFQNILTDSYRDMPSVFHDLYQQLFDYTSNNLFTTKKDTTIAELPAGRRIEDIPLLLDICDGFPTRADEEIEFELGDFGGSDPQGQYSTQSNISTVEESLKILGGDGTFHSGQNGIHQHNTFTELNGIINLLPIQTYAYKYTYFMDMHHPNGDHLNFIIPVWAFSYIIADINLNITSLVPQTINIQGVAISEDLVPETELYYGCRQFMFSTSTTNKFTWNRVWFNELEMNNTTLSEQSVLFSSLLIPSFNPAAEIGQPFIPSSNFDISENIFLQPGNNTVRGRMVLQTTRLRGAGAGGNIDPYDDMSISFDITSNNFSDINYSFNF